MLINNFIKENQNERSWKNNLKQEKIIIFHQMDSLNKNPQLQQTNIINLLKQTTHMLRQKTEQLKVKNNKENIFQLSIMLDYRMKTRRYRERKISFLDSSQLAKLIK